MLTDEQINKAEEKLTIIMDQIQVGLAAKDQEQARNHLEAGLTVYMLGEDNTPQFLELIATVRTLQQQNEQLVEAVLDAEVYHKLDEDIPDDKELAYELGYKDALWNLSDAIRSLQDKPL